MEGEGSQAVIIHGRDGGGGGTLAVVIHSQPVTPCRRECRSAHMIAAFVLLPPANPKCRSGPQFDTVALTCLDSVFALGAEMT